jgi:hypothetical protein
LALEPEADDAPADAIEAQVVFERPVVVSPALMVERPAGREIEPEAAAAATDPRDARAEAVLYAEAGEPQSVVVDTALVREISGGPAGIEPEAAHVPAALADSSSELEPTETMPLSESIESAPEPATVTDVLSGSASAVDPVAGAPSSAPSAPPPPASVRWAPLPIATAQAWPRLFGVAADYLPPSAADVLSASSQPSSESAAAAKTDQPEWVELIESLRIDLARRRAERESTNAPRPPARVEPARARRNHASDETPADAAHASQKRRAKAHRPIQDEWGFFDPEQCGFAALLAKLDELNEPQNTEPHRRA